MAKNTIHFRTKVEILERLRNVIVENGDGTCYYKESHSDTSVALTFEGVTANNVAYVRAEMFGQIKYPPKKETSIEELDMRIDQLTDRLQKQESMLAELMRQLGEDAEKPFIAAATGRD